MRILALDPGSQTGWAIGDHDGQPRSGIYRVPKVQNELDAPTAYKFVSLETFLIELIKHNVVDRVAFEEPFNQGKGGIPRSFASEVTRWGYAAVIGMAALKCGVRCSAIPVTSWRSQAGMPTQAPKQVKGSEARRKWLKAEGRRRCSTLGFEVSSDDEADATLLWHAMAKAIRDKEAAPDLFAAVTL